MCTSNKNLLQKYEEPWPLATNQVRCYWENFSLPMYTGNDMKAVASVVALGLLPNLKHRQQNQTFSRVIFIVSD